MKKLRRKGIADVAAANAFLETEYWADHNRRFAQPPASMDDFHVAVPRALRLDQVFRLEERRTVSNDWVVRYDNRYLQIERQSHRPPARSTVLVYEAADRRIEIRYRDHLMRWTEIAPASLLAKQTTTPRAWQAPRHRPVVALARRERQVPNVDHPWRRGYEERAAKRAAQVTAMTSNLWKLPERWTRRARAHRSLENHRTVFYELPQAFFLR